MTEVSAMLYPLDQNFTRSVVNTAQQVTSKNAKEIDSLRLNFHNSTTRADTIKSTPHPGR
ncbi:hypothetical protein NBRC116495_01480 [Aurantivibrio plasticivorans]